MLLTAPNCDGADTTDPALKQQWLSQQWLPQQYQWKWLR